MNIKKGITKIVSITILIAAMMAAMGITSFADEIDDIVTKEVRYLDESGNTKTLARSEYKVMGLEVTEDDPLESGWYVIIGVGTLMKRMEVTGDTKIILVNGTNIDFKGGIHVPEGKTLSIYGQEGSRDSWGRIKLKGENGCAGIGGNRTKSSESPEKTGTINIHGGFIEATGGDGAAGIGGGFGIVTYGSGRFGGDGGTFNMTNGWVVLTGGASAAGLGGGIKGNSGTINLLGGTIEAYGGEFGSGIGGGRNVESGGYYDDTGGSAEDITIDGAVVRAFGGKYAAGVGGGRAGNGSVGSIYDREADKKWITVKSGSLYAVGGEGGAGIGGGLYPLNDWFEKGRGANVKITGGTVHAVGGKEAAGIGAARSEVEGAGETIITGGTVRAQGGEYAAGIGTGNKPAKVAGKLYNIKISGTANVTADGGKEAAGIGTGNEGLPGAGANGELEISDNAVVTAQGGKYGAGIGGGDQAVNGKITIRGGEVNATGGYGGSGIGVGDGANEKATASEVNIEGGTVKAQGGELGAGIGGGDTADMKLTLNVTGGKITARGGNMGAGIGGGNHTWISGGGKGGTVNIKFPEDESSDDYVYAIAGGTASPIGHGQDGEGSGTLNLQSRLSVSSSSVETSLDNVKTKRPDGMSERIDMCHSDGGEAYIENCRHNGAKYTYLNESEHLLRCPNCGTEENQAHIKTDTEPCRKCNYRGETWEITIKEGRHTRDTIKVAKGDSINLPVPDEKRIPSGSLFTVWASEEYADVAAYDFDALTDEQIARVKEAIANGMKAGSVFSPESNTTFTAIYTKSALVRTEPGDGASGEVDFETLPMYTTIKLPGEAKYVAPSGKTFEAWDVRPAADGEGKLYEPGAEYTIEGEKVWIFAKWKDVEHTHDLKHHDRKEATCDDAGSMEYWECETCGRCYKDAEAKDEIKKGDTIIPAAGHNYGEPVYTWSDDKAKVEAVRICLSDSTHVEKETAETVSETVLATCAKEGTTTYTATFKNEAFEKQTAVVKLDRIPHNWSEWTIKPDDDTKDIRTCLVCGAVEEQEVGHRHDMKKVDGKAADCTHSGVKEHFECQKCGKWYLDKDGNQLITEDAAKIPAAGHVMGNAVKLEDETKATCEDHGNYKTQRTCTKCGFKETPEIHVTEPTGHNWDYGKVVKEATCEEAGTKTYTCLNDGSHTRTEQIPAQGHDWTSWEESVEDGTAYDVRHCTRCDQVQKVARDPAGCEHKELTIIKGRAATCLEAGTADYYQCNYCKAYLYIESEGSTPVVLTKDNFDEYMEKLVIRPLGHEFGEPVYTWAEDNSKVTARATCSRCNEVIDETVATKSEVTKEATCKETGWTRYKAVFENEVFGIQTKDVNNIKETDHKWDGGAIKEPTCDREGESILTCTVCGQTKTTPIDKLPHKLTKVKALDADCQHQGVKEHYECESCGRLFSDEAGKTEVDAKDLAIPVNGDKHTRIARKEKENDVAATCTKVGGYDIIVYCEDCNAVIAKEHVVRPRLGHKWGEWKTTKEPTETEAGEEQRVCENDPSHVETRVIPVVGHEHKLTKVEAVKADCEHDGNIEYYACTGGEHPCGRIFEDEAGTKELTQDEITEYALGHNWGDPVRENELGATCTAPAEFDEVVYCTRCKLEMSRERKTEGSALGHEYKEVEGTAVNATCTDDGKTADRKCVRCDDTIKGTSIPATGHRWTEPGYEWASDNSEVTASRVCVNNPEHKETETVKTVKEVVKEATEDDEGEVRYTATFKNTAFGARVKTEIIPKVEPQPEPEDRTKKMGEDGTPFGKGAALEAAETALAGMKSDSDPAGTKIAPLMLKSTKQTKKSIKLTWKTAKGATKYIVYANKCGKTKKLTKLAELASSKRAYTVKKAAGKKLKKATYYKFIMIAVDAENNVVSSSKITHVATAGSRKAGNPKKVVVKAKVSKTGKKLKKYKATSAIAVKKGKTTTLKSTFTKAKKTKVKKHVGIRYESSNTAIVTITKKGKVKGIKKGTAKIYAYAQNGVVKAVKVKVK